MEQGMVDDKDSGSEQRIQNTFGWYGVIIQIANEDILKVKDVLKINHIEVLNFITYITDLNEKRKREIKQQFK